MSDPPTAVTLAGIAPTPLKKFREYAAQAPKEPDPTQTPRQGKKDQPRGAEGSRRRNLGPVDMAAYLDHYGVAYSLKDPGRTPGKNIYRLHQCLFDSAHTRNEASIIQDDAGVISYQCFHDSCKGNPERTWSAARRVISGDDSLAPFCQDYDPNWTPRFPSKKSTGKKDEPREREDTNAGIPNQPWLTYSKSGRPRFNVAAMVDHLEQAFEPVVFEGKDFTGLFFRYDETWGVWRWLPEAQIRSYIRRKLGEYATPEHITRAASLFGDQVFCMPEELEYDPMVLNLKNGMLDLRTMEISPHAPEYMSRNQLPVTYDPEAKCRLWEDKLIEIFEDDLAKVGVLQEFFGYCLYPKIVFPAALFQIGGGANGKGVVERVLYTMLGYDNVSHISLARMERDFGPIELRGKLLNTCGETETKPLDVTNFKKIVDGNRIQAEVKYKNDVKYTPIAKHMISMNDFPGIKDRTDAFFRRLIVLEYKQSFTEADDDPFLNDKLEAEMEGIFKWSLEGLSRVLENKQIWIPETVAQAKGRFRTKVNPVRQFVEEELSLGEELQVSPPMLYTRYKEWALDSGLKPLGKINFYEQIQLNYKVLRIRPHNSTTEMFQGIGLKDVLSA